MASTEFPASPRHTLGGAIGRLSSQWGWFVALGALAVALGCAALALVVSATVASILVIGGFIIITGVAEIDSSAELSSLMLSGTGDRVTRGRVRFAIHTPPGYSFTNRRKDAP